VTKMCRIGLTLAGLVVAKYDGVPAEFVHFVSRWFPEDLIHFR
jgi:hypothetical protein